MSAAMLVGTQNQAAALMTVPESLLLAILYMFLAMLAILYMFAVMLVAVLYVFAANGVIFYMCAAMLAPLV